MRTAFSPEELPEASKLKQLHTLARMGFIRSIEAMLSEIEISTPATATFCGHMRQLLDNHRLHDFLSVLDGVNHA